MKRIVTMLLALSMLLAMTACAGTPEATAPAPKETTALQAASEETTPDTRMITDGMDRDVEIPDSVP